MPWCRTDCAPCGAFVTRPPSTSVPPDVAAGPSTLPGQPPPGSLYYGASVPHHQSLPAWEPELGTVLPLNRSYFIPDENETAQLVARCRNDLARGRMPHVSIKPEGTWQDIASGAPRRLAGPACCGRWARRTSPILFTLNHEPENDAGPPGMAPSDYVAMQRRAISLAAELAPQVIVAPVLQHWTFDPAAQGQRSGGVARPGSIGLRPRRLQPVVTDERQGVAHLRQQARRGDRLVRRTRRS